MDGSTTSRGSAAWLVRRQIYRFPWSRRPQFTGVGIVAVTTKGLFANIGLNLSDLEKVENADLVVRVFDGYRTSLSWESKGKARSGH